MFGYEDYDYESELESARRKVETKTLESNLKTWEARLAKVEEAYRITITTQEKRISKLECKLRTIKAKLKLSNAKIKNLEAKLNGGDVWASDAYVDSQLETETSDVEYNGYHEETLNSTRGRSVSLGDRPDSSESAKENIPGNKSPVSKKKFGRTPSRQSNFIQGSNSELVLVENENTHADSDGAPAEETYEQYEGEDEMTCSDGSSPYWASWNHSENMFAKYGSKGHRVDYLNGNYIPKGKGQSALGIGDRDSYEGMDMNDHDAESHEVNVEIEPFECPVCQNAYPEMKELLDHLGSHSTSSSSPLESQEYETIVCSMCNESFQQKKQLQKHMRTHATSPKNKDRLDVLPTNCNMKTCEAALPLRSVTEVKTQDRSHSLAGEKASNGEQGKTQRESCSKISPNAYRLRAHSDEKKAFCCRGCGEKFQRRAGLRLHVNVCTVFGGERCDLCGTVYANIRSLRRHVQTVHAKKKGNTIGRTCKKCPRCLKVCLTDFLYRKHVSALTCKHKCGQCNKSFSSLSSLRGHQKEVHGVQGKPKRTVTSPKTIAPRKKLPVRTNNRGRITNRAKTKSPKSTTKVDESKSKGQTNRSPPRVSVSLKNMKEIPECPTCKKTFSTKHSLQRHLQIHQERDYTCMLCKEDFSTWPDFENHVEDAHPEAHGTEKRLPPIARGRPSIRKYICSQCYTEFSSKEQLLKHFACNHAWLKPFKCDQCEKSFVSSELLKRHQSLH